LKVYASASWDVELLDQLAGIDAICVIDLEGHQSGHFPSPSLTPEQQALIAERLPAVLLEDPRLDGRYGDVLAGASPRFSWDAIAYSAADLEKLQEKPAAVNSNPRAVVR
jgi:hypothetical protein